MIVTIKTKDKGLIRSVSKSNLRFKNLNNKTCIFEVERSLFSDICNSLANQKRNLNSIFRKHYELNTRW